MERELLEQRLVDGVVIRFLKFQPRGVWLYRRENAASQWHHRPRRRVEFFATYTSRTLGRPIRTDVIHSWILNVPEDGQFVPVLAARAKAAGMVAIDVFSVQPLAEKDSA